MYLHAFDITVIKEKVLHIANTSKSDDIVLKNTQTTANTLHSRQTTDDCVLFKKPHVYESSIMSLLVFPLQYLKHIKPSEVESEFHYVTEHVIELLRYCHPALLVQRCRQLMASEIHKINLFSINCIKKLKSFQASSTLLKMLSVFWSWSNHSILTFLAQFSELAVILLEEFDSRLLLSISITDDTFPPLLHPYEHNYYTLLTFKCKDCLQCSFQLVCDMQSILIEKCQITHHALQLLSVQRDPLELHWMIPNRVVDLINKKISQHYQCFFSKGVVVILIYIDKKYYINHDLKTESMIILPEKEVQYTYIYVIAIICNRFTKTDLNGILYQKYIPINLK